MKKAVILCVLVILLFIVPVKADWLSGWGYRKAHYITGSTAGAQIDYQIRLKVFNITGTDTGDTVYLGDKVRPDFGDVRFTNSSGSPLNYWLESVGSTSATFWVQIDSIPASPSNATMYVYYGNGEATTTSNGTETFIKFDDMNSGTTQADQWAVTVYSDTAGSNPLAYEGSYHDMSVGTTSGSSGGGRSGILDVEELKPSIKQTATYVGGSSGIHYPVNDTVAVDFDYYLKTLSPSSEYWTVFAYVVFKDSMEIEKMVRLKDAYGLGYEFRENYFVNGASSIDKSVTIGNTTILGGDDTATWYSKSIHSTAYTKNSITNVYLGVSGGFDNNVGYGSIEAYFDNVRVRKYVSPEPSQGDWGSEETPGLRIPLWLFALVGIFAVVVIAILLYLKYRSKSGTT